MEELMDQKVTGEMRNEGARGHRVHRGTGRGGGCESLGFSCRSRAVCWFHSERLGAAEQQAVEAVS